MYHVSCVTCILILMHRPLFSRACNISRRQRFQKVNPVILAAVATAIARPGTSLPAGKLRLLPSLGSWCRRKILQALEKRGLCMRYGTTTRARATASTYRPASPQSILVSLILTRILVIAIRILPLMEHEVSRPLRTGGGGW